MEEDALPQNRCLRKNVLGNRRITAFTAQKKQYGLEIQVAGCLELHPSPRTPDYIVGTIELGGKPVPVIKSKNKHSSVPLQITDNTCIVLFENKIGETIFTIARIYDDVSEVFDLMVQTMDCKPGGSPLCSFSEHTCENVLGPDRMTLEQIGSLLDDQ